jgi:hypothetical protein
MPWIYLCRDRAGAWAVAQNRARPEGLTPDGAVEVRLLGACESEAVAALAVAEVDRRLKEQEEQSRWGRRGGWTG